jgi:hypothetical protein
MTTFGFGDLCVYMSHNCDNCARSVANRDDSICDIESWLTAASYADEIIPVAIIERCGIGTQERCNEFEALP